MPRALTYILFFLAMVLLQTFMLNNLNLSTYIHPMIYLAFVVLLPMELAPVWVLLSGLAMGITMDVAAGSAGLNSAAILFCSFARPAFLRLVMSRDDIREGGIPSSHKLGKSKFLKYCFALVLAHSLIYFSLEAATWSFFYLTLLRMALSACFTTLLIFFCQLPIFNR